MTNSEKQEWQKVTVSCRSRDFCHMLSLSKKWQRASLLMKAGQVKEKEIRPSEKEEKKRNCSKELWRGKIHKQQTQWLVPWNLWIFILINILAPCQWELACSSNPSTTNTNQHSFHMKLKLKISTQSETPTCHQWTWNGSGQGDCQRVEYPGNLLRIVTKRMPARRCRVYFKIELSRL